MREPIYFLDIYRYMGIDYYEITDKSIKNIREKEYYISIDGQVIDRQSHIILKQYYNGEYLNVILSNKHGDTIIYPIHRLMAETFNYVEDCKSLQVNHIDYNKINNSIENLEWLTLVGNNHHARLNNLLCTGEDCSWSKLSENDVRNICELIMSKSITISEIAKMYNCSVTTIGDIARGRTWKNVSMDYNLDYNLRDRFSEFEVHTICKIFSQNKEKSLQYLYYLIIYHMGWPDDIKIKKRISKLYYRNPKNYKYITDLYDY